MWSVTGATGFIGGRLVRDLVGARGISRAEVGEWNPSNLERMFAGAEGVVHAASVVHAPKTPPEVYERFNVDGTRAVVEAARRAGVRKLVFVSSIKVYGESPSGVLDEKLAPAADAHYARTKLHAERIVLAAEDLAPVVLRLSPVYGVGEKGNVRTMIRAIQRRRFFVPGRGDTKKSIVHVSTVVDVVSAALARESRGIFVVADRETPSIRELANRIARRLGRRNPPSLPIRALRLVAGGVGRVAGLVGVETAISSSLIVKATTDSVCDPSRVERELGVACHVDLDDKLDEEIAWLRSLKEI